MSEQEADKQQLLEEYARVREEVDWYVDLLSDSNRARGNYLYLRLFELEEELGIKKQSE